VLGFISNTNIYFDSKDNKYSLIRKIPHPDDLPFLREVPEGGRVRMTKIVILFFAK
jgi:hypothetical protein